MPLCERVNVKKTWSFSEPVTDHVSRNRQDLTSKVFANNDEAWISNGPSLCAVQIPSGHPRPIWNFGKTLKDTMDVTCVEQLSLDYNERSSFLLVGTSSDKRSQLCFMNLNTNLLFRAVNLPFQVRCISIIDDGLGSVNPLPDVLSKMQGIVALGGADGSVILMDVNRSNVVQGSKWSAVAASEYSSDESKPHRSKVISLPSDDLDSYFKELREFQRNGDSLALSLLVGHGNDGVTCLQYSKLTSSLYVGFSSGTWQIWNISTFELMYENVDIDLPVFSFCEMEPCDDPDAVIYLWVSYQSATTERDPHPCLSFHSTVYDSKYHVQDYGVYYKDFLNCAPNFVTSIRDEINNCVGSKLISCEAFAQSIPRNLLYNIGLPPAEDGQCRLFVAAFNAYGGSKSSSTWLCVFDLEQWYRERLPKDARHNNYFMEWIEIYPEELLTVKVVQDSIRLPSFEEPQEIHLIPEALNFDIVAINREGIISIEKVGRQTRWLRNVSFLGARSLLHVDRVYQSCVAGGFVPEYAHNDDGLVVTDEQKRSYVLSVCLEHGLKDVILEAAELWSDGHFTVKNCTLRYLLDWLWSSLQCCFKQFNKKCETLFSAPGYEIDDRMKRSLHRAEVVLCLIESLFVEIVKNHGTKIWADCPEQRLSAMSLIRLVVSQITWFLGCGLLPEANSDGLPSSSPVYNFDAIARFSKKRREHLRNLMTKKRLLGDGHVIPPACGLYLADSLLTTNQNSVYSQWEIEGGMACYPPPSLQSLLRICTVVDVLLSDKMSVIYYAVLDYVDQLDKKKFPTIIKKIMSFDYLPGITMRKAKVVKGFWLIDHSEYEEGVRLLLDQSVQNSDLTDDQHRAVIRVLLLEGESKLALHYLKIRHPRKFEPNDLKYHLSLLLTNKNLVHQAFQFIRQHSQFKHQLLVQFFAGCIETKEINQVFKFHLDPFELEVLENFLASRKGQLYEDLHVLLMLTRSRYTDAIALHEKYSHNGVPKDPLKFDTRDTIIKGISSSLCDVTKREAMLLNNPNLLNLPETRGLKANKPLSVYLKCSRENGLSNFRYNSDQVMAVCLASCRIVNREGVAGSDEQQLSGKQRQPVDAEMPLTGSLREASIVGPSRKRQSATVKSPPLSRSVKRARLDPSTEIEKTDAQPKTNAVSTEIASILDMPLVRRRSKEGYSTPGRSETGPPSSILKSGKTPQTPGPGTAAQAAENDTPRKTLRWNIPTDPSKETIVNSVRKTIVPLSEASQAVGDQEPSSPDSIKGRLRPRKSQESPPVEERKIVPEDDWKAIKDATAEKPLFAVSLPPSKKKLVPAVPDENEPSFIERLKKLTESTQRADFVEQMDVDVHVEEKEVSQAADLSITIDSSEMSIFHKNKDDLTPDTVELKKTILIEQLEEDKKEEDNAVAIEEPEEEFIVQQEEEEEDEASPGMEALYEDLIPAEEEQVTKEAPVSHLEEAEEKKSRESSVDQIQIRHAVSLSQVQHLEEDDDEESEDPEEAEIPPVIEFFPPEEGLVINPKYRENVEEEDGVEVERDTDENEDEGVEYEAQPRDVDSEKEESNDKPSEDGSDGSSVICLSDSDKSEKEENEEDLSPDYDSDSSSGDVTRGNRSFFHDKYNVGPAESEEESHEGFELKVNESFHIRDEEAEEEQEAVEEEELDVLEEDEARIETVKSSDEVQEPTERLTAIAEEEEEDAQEATDALPVGAEEVEEEREVQDAVQHLQTINEEDEEKDKSDEVEVTEEEQSAQPETKASPIVDGKAETLDLINLNKGQMFFGSPDNLKSTTNSDLATFQIAPGSNLPPPSPEPSKVEDKEAVSREELVVSKTEESISSTEPVNIGGFVADTYTPNSPMSTPLRKSLRLLQRQTPGRQIVPDDEVVESDRSLDVAVIGDSTEDSSGPRMVDKSVLTVKRSRRRQSSEPPELLSQRSESRRTRRASSIDPQAIDERSVNELRRLRRASSTSVEVTNERSSPPKETVERKRRSGRSSSTEPVPVKKEKRSRKTSESQSSVNSHSSVEPQKRTSRRTSKTREDRSRASMDRSPERNEYKKNKPRHSITEPLDARKQKQAAETPAEPDKPTTASRGGSRKRATSLNEYPISTRSRRPTALASIQEVAEDSASSSAPKRRATRSAVDGEGGGPRRSRAPSLPPSYLDINKWLQLQNAQKSRRSKRLTAGESSSASQQSSPRRSPRIISRQSIQLHHLYDQWTDDVAEDEDAPSSSPARSSVTSVVSSKMSSARRRPSSRNSATEDLPVTPLPSMLTMSQEEKEQIFEEHSQQRIMTRKQTTFLQRCLGLESATPTTPGNASGSSSPSRRTKEDEDTPKTSRKKPH